METLTTTETKTTFALRAVSADGQVKYYTGRAGDGWLADSATEAFEYRSIEEARRKATNFNRMMTIHGWRFVAEHRIDAAYRLGDRVSVKNENTGEVLAGEITFVYENGPWFEVDTDDLNTGMYHRDLIVGKVEYGIVCGMHHVGITFGMGTSEASTTGAYWSHIADQDRATRFTSRKNAELWAAKLTADARGARHEVIEL